MPEPITAAEALRDPDPGGGRPERIPGAAAAGMVRERLRTRGLAALLFTASLAATVTFCRSMSGAMEMPGGWAMSMIWMRMPGQSWWSAGGMFLAMWLVMMVAMMLPSAFPGLLFHRRSLCVATGYFLLWSAIGAPVFVLGVATAEAAMRWPPVSRIVPPLAALMVVAAGLIQFAPWKAAGLRRCRVSPAGGDGPLPPVTSHSGDRVRAIACGLRCGASCAVCCSGYMLSLLAVGVMNLPLMGILAILIALEKLAPRPERIVRLSGVAGVLAGMTMLARWLLSG